MTIKTEFEREVDILLSELEGERTKANRRAELAIIAAQEIERKVRSLRETVAIYREHHGLAQPEIEIDESLRQEFEGLSTKDALVRIAEENHGILEGSDATKILVKAGMFRDDKNASSAVYSTVKRHLGTFRKLARGKYQLILRRVSQTATIPVESEGAGNGGQFKPSVAAPGGNGDDAWELEDDESPPQAPEHPRAQIAG